LKVFATKNRRCQEHDLTSTGKNQEPDVVDVVTTDDSSLPSPLKADKVVTFPSPADPDPQEAHTAAGACVPTQTTTSLKDTTKELGSCTQAQGTSTTTTVAVVVVQSSSQNPISVSRRAISIFSRPAARMKKEIESVGTRRKKSTADAGIFTPRVATDYSM